MTHPPCPLADCPATEAHPHPLLGDGLYGPRIASQSVTEASEQGSANIASLLGTWNLVEGVSKVCRECGNTFVGPTFKGSYDAAKASGQPLYGLCPKCVKAAPTVTYEEPAKPRLRLADSLPLRDEEAWWDK